MSASAGMRVGALMRTLPCLNSDDKTIAYGDALPGDPQPHDE